MIVSWHLQTLISHDFPGSNGSIPWLNNLSRATIDTCPSRIAASDPETGLLICIEKTTRRSSATKVLATIDLIMRTDIKQDYFILRESKEEYDPIRIAETHRVFVAVLSLESVEPKLRRTGVNLELEEHILEKAGQFGVAAEKLAGRTFKGFGPD